MLKTSCADGADPRELLRSKLAALGLADALGFLTACSVARHHTARRRVDGVEAWDREFSGVAT